MKHLKSILVLLFFVSSIGLLFLNSDIAFAEEADQNAKTQGKDLENLTDEEKQQLFQVALYHLVKQGNYDDVALLLKNSIQKEDPWALLMLGTAYNYAKKAKEGLELLEKSASKNYAPAYSSMGELYTAGEIVDKDLTKALSMFRQGAILGDEISKSYLGDFYRNGWGVQVDEKQAFYWYMEAAKSGDYYAQSRVADSYLIGAGVETNPDEAIRWYTKAANQNDAYSQFQLGNLYGVTTDLDEAPVYPDLIEAYKWYSLSALQGDKEAEEARKDLESHLTPKQLEEASKRIAEWKPTPYQQSEEKDIK